MIKDIALTSLLNYSIPELTTSFNDIIKFLDKEIKFHDPSVTGSALSNAHGDWYEWLLAIAGWNYCVENPSANLAMLTPNVTQFNIENLYQKSLSDLVVDLKEKLHSSSDVKLISSNPDFVIINRKLVNDIIPILDKITGLNIQAIHMLDNIYQKFISKCSFEGILGYISVKASLRPDRRLQIPHEGSLMKALYTHLQTREWILNPKGIKYYAISTNISNADQNALKTVATHSITTVHSVPQAAVDNVFQVDSMLQAQNAFDVILNS